jgi:hypothetical protein
LHRSVRYEATLNFISSPRPKAEPLGAGHLNLAMMEDQRYRGSKISNLHVAQQRHPETDTVAPKN